MPKQDGKKIVFPLYERKNGVKFYYCPTNQKQSLETANLDTVKIVMLGDRDLKVPRHPSEELGAHSWWQIILTGERPPEAGQMITLIAYNEYGDAARLDIYDWEEKNFYGDNTWIGETKNIRWWHWDKEQSIRTYHDLAEEE